MFKYNKLRYYLGIPCVVMQCDRYYVGRGVVARTILAYDEYYWWYGNPSNWGSYKTSEEAYVGYKKLKALHEDRKARNKITPV